MTRQERLRDPDFQDAVIAAIEEQFTSLDHPGFCLTCGEPAYDCEPDARNYKCEACGAMDVFGAEEILMLL